MSTLTVELNEGAVHDISAPDRFTTHEPFTIEMHNHGQPMHVHLNLDDELAQVASIGASNHYVEAESTGRVRVDTASPSDSVGGKLKIVTGYGSGTKYVDVVVEPPPERTDPVIVDESLSAPRERQVEPPVSRQLGETVDRLVATGSVPALAFAALAVLVAIAIGVLVDSVVVLLGVGVVIGAAIAAVVLIIQ